MKKFVMIFVAIALCCGPAMAESSGALGAYVEVRRVATAQLDLLTKDALAKFEAADYTTYLKWVAADKVHDFELLSELAKTPAGAEYMRAVAPAIAAFENIKASAHDIYEQTRSVSEAY